MEERTGHIFLNGKELNSQSGSAFFAATENDELLHTDKDQLDGTGLLEQTSQQGDNMAEAAWRRMSVSLHCGQSKMKIKAMGPGSVNLELAMGNGPPLPLFQVPEQCGYSMRQNALGFVLVVPYDGCNVIQEYENFVLPMSWLRTSVEFTCPVSGSSTLPPATTTPKPAHQPRKLPLRLRPWGLNRPKRQVEQPLPYYDPSAYMYYYNMLTTTTAKPTTTTTKPPSVQPLPSYPYSYDPYMYYLYYYYYYYYPQYFQVPTTTAKPTTASTTKATPKPGGPEDPDVYYYPIIQHFYGSPPYSQTTQPPGDTTTPTSETTAPTMEPTTPTPTSSTTTPSSNVYPGPMKPHVPYYENPFPLQVAYNKAGKLPDDQKYIPQYGLKSGLEAGAHPHPGFNYWQPGPWFSQKRENPH
ncbi:adhesive plaque matrix protein-like [Centropristis striata]|uniref:adhesive plaque matrix protein-like n=1 Tax=Centropristis striata TaxID=184440 RepID=UPI0027E18218|nr:adhesive plaque matrix protein-like [Centropristis striata]